MEEEIDGLAPLVCDSRCAGGTRYSVRVSRCFGSWPVLADSILSGLLRCTPVAPRRAFRTISMVETGLERPTPYMRSDKSAFNGPCSIRVFEPLSCLLPIVLPTRTASRIVGCEGPAFHWERGVSHKSAGTARTFRRSGERSPSRLLRSNALSSGRASFPAHYKERQNRNCCCDDRSR
jgi:hypothetical protein